jgi:hypothetical protein
VSDTELVDIPAEPTNAPRIPTRADLLAARKQEERGFLFRLHRSGYDAHVRWLSISDLATLVGLPVAQQNIVLKVFNDYRRDQEKQSGQRNIPLTWDKVLENQAGGQEIADVLVCNGFIKPRVVMTERDLDPNDPHMIVVTDLHKQERLRYSQIALGQNEEEAEKLAPFPEEGVGRVEAVPVLPQHEQGSFNQDAVEG